MSELLALPCLDHLSLEEQTLLNQTEEYLKQQVAPIAAQLDRDPQVLQQAFQALGDRQLLGLRVPQAWQGSGASELALRAFQELFARYCGSLAFLQTQHQSAAARLAQCWNSALKQKYLPDLANGKKRIGLGFSQLRRKEPMTKAIPISGGYRISGEVPWITGYGCFEEFIIGATLPDGEAVFGLVPLENSSDFESEIKLELLQLAAMGSTNTVQAHLTNWFLPADRVLDLKPAGWLEQSDQNNVLHHGFFALGCAQAGLDIVAKQADSGDVIKETLITLQQELHRCRRAMYEAQALGDTGVEQLESRGWAIELAVRCAHAGVIVSRGAANYADHPAQRVYREALAFTVFGQTSAVMAATLKQLVGRSEK